MKTIDIRIHIEYDPDKFPQADMEWAADKIAETDVLYNIGYDFDSFDKTSSVTFNEEA